MSLIEINWNPSARQLRQFAVISLAALPVLGWLWSGGALVVGLLTGVGLVAAILGAFWPHALKPAYLALTLVTAPIGLVVGELAMLAIFFGVLLPIGLVFRLVRRDALQRSFDRSAKTYFKPKRQAAAAASYYRQS